MTDELDKEPIKLIAGQKEEPEQISKPRRVGRFLLDNIAAVVVIIVVASLFIADNVLDSRRQTDIQDEIKTEQDILSGLNTIVDNQGQGQDRILCLADRTDLLIDIELDGLTTEDLSPAELELLNTSCREDEGSASDSEE